MWVSADSAKPVIQRSTAVLIAAAAFAGGAALSAIVGAIVSSSSPDAPTGSAATSTLPVQVSLVPPTKTTQEVPPAGGVGQTVVNGGITLTVDAVSEPPRIERSREGTVAPQPGAKFVQVDTTIKNTGTKSIDLTCSYPVANKLWDADKRQFDTVDSLYELPGNPGCNDSLQPGFSSKMTYGYEIPQDAVVACLRFADSDVDYGANTSFISLKP